MYLHTENKLSRPRLSQVRALQAISAFHPSEVGKWVPASAGKAKAGMVHSVSGCTRGVQEKLWDHLRTCAIPERHRGAFTTRRYTNPRLPYLTLQTHKQRDTIIHITMPTKYLWKHGARYTHLMPGVCTWCQVYAPDARYTHLMPGVCTWRQVYAPDARCTHLMPGVRTWCQVYEPDARYTHLQVYAPDARYTHLMPGIRTCMK